MHLPNWSGRPAGRVLATQVWWACSLGMAPCLPWPPSSSPLVALISPKAKQTLACFPRSFRRLKPEAGGSRVGPRWCRSPAWSAATFPCREVSPGMHARPEGSLYPSCSGPPRGAVRCITSPALPGRTISHITFASIPRVGSQVLQWPAQGHEASLTCQHPEPYHAIQVDL